MMNYYQHHVFFCTNQRGPEASRPCCAAAGSDAVRLYAKKRLKELGLHGEGKIRINSSGCLDRCELGPTLVVYPEGIWYCYLDESDVDEIIDSHLLKGQIVERLLLPGGEENISCPDTPVQEQE
ncbi:MAG: (2Fe-2S) ferredoxin domain-containing protein [Gammaproteobacteria bacterium]|nr:(2Fe-2S) ferredoxin domain-containing protein [Gammaproteobacteria bacterium]NNM14192.1 (2Fe-2S) ferredoxin domain-containing protein [Gammaproteobacteria bacterium]